QDIVEKLSLDGVFELAKAEFTDPEVQNKIEDLSQSSRGKHDEPNDERIMSNLAGSFRLANGTASFSKLSFNVPGAQVKLAGHYGLVNEELDFKGRLLMQEKLSGTQTGVKSVFLRLVDPFFKGKNTGTDLPIKITGTRAEPKFGLDW
ncbi:MAG TPA: AsmA-like C-terminal region-containing protein, partial [Acidobacteriota bacterium]|nr:AsmA-like C-terminal region-containing protein [Acidobacteriota bacterium]